MEACLVYLIMLLVTPSHAHLLLTPSSVVPVCPGDRLHLTCNVSSFLVQWTVYDTNNGMNYSRLTAASPSSGITRTFPLQVGSFTFNFASQVVNNTGSSNLSLISNITVDNVTIALNATVIICTEHATGIQDMVTVNVIDTNEFFADVSQDESFGNDDITLTLMFRRAVGVSYTITSLPHAQIMYFNEDTSARLMLTYNTEYNVSIIATVCGYRNASEIITLKYVNCGSPTKRVSSREIITEIGNSIAMEGAVANFSCPPGLALTGPNTATCMENGEWEPDPRQTECKADCGVPSVDSKIDFLYNSTLEGAMLSFWCKNSTSSTIAVCGDDGVWRPSPAIESEDMCVPSPAPDPLVVLVVSSLSAFVAGSVIFFVTGCLCGQCVDIRRKKNKMSTSIEFRGDAVQPTQENEYVIKEEKTL